MPNLSEHFQLDVRPVAKEEAMVRGPRVRFTVLTSRLLRLEYSPEERFENRASQAFWYREQPAPEFEVRRDDEQIEIETEHLLLRYHIQPAGFTPETLSITLKSQAGEDENADEDVTWHYGDENPENLRGTVRTLDFIDGSTDLPAGLMSRAGWAVVDDSESLVFNDESWIEAREAAPGARDLYFFGYGRRYKDCLRDFCRVAGQAPMAPRWALGNWWSRFWEYSQEELEALMSEFEAHEVPLSVCIVDMDWHTKDTTGAGEPAWTGYTWNEELFPDREAFLDFLHAKGLRTALNLHPHAGVQPLEADYPVMARRMGIDPASKTPVRFDIADPTFTQAYFEVLHHPKEAEGVDFWWMDWQQGEETSIPGLDPLWWLNHLHFLDAGRDGEQRPFIFSRWGGLGNHRYPIGFSGDTYVTWDTLAFQPYFTATAANVNYGWWSHDIGGHMSGVEGGELYTRWVQFGVFSPITRLHSTKNPFSERRPWGYDAEVFRVTREAFQLRHALIPYIYTMAWQNHQTGVPLVRPMYYEAPDEEAAYLCPEQYAFGSEMIVAPFTAPADPETRLSRQVVWLPTMLASQDDGAATARQRTMWYDFFTGAPYEAGWHALYGALADVPVFVRAGAIVPLGPKVGWGGVDAPDELTVHIFAGADHEFTLYEDDGETTAYKADDYILTHFTQVWEDDALTFVISPEEPDGMASEVMDILPLWRSYHLRIHGVQEPATLTVIVDDDDYSDEFFAEYDADAEELRLTVDLISLESEVRIVLRASGSSLLARRDRTPEICRRMLAAFQMETWSKQQIAEHLDEICEDPANLEPYVVSLTAAQRRALLEVSQQMGVHRIRQRHYDDLLLMWNARARPEMTYRLSAWDYRTRFEADQGPAPDFKAIVPQKLRDAWVKDWWRPPHLKWELAVHYGNMVTVTYER